ncbi:MAG: hypothetical protein ACRDTQ_15385 [Micromonosporaceae bacterium]
MTEAPKLSTPRQARDRLLTGLAETSNAMAAASKHLATAIREETSPRLTNARDHLQQATALIAVAPPTRITMVIVRQAGKTLMCAGAVFVIGVVAAGVFKQPPGWMVTAGLAAAAVAAVSSGELMLRLRRVYYQRALASRGRALSQEPRAASDNPLQRALELLRKAEMSVSSMAAAFMSEHRWSAAAQSGPGFAWFARADPTVRDLSVTHAKLCLAISAIEKSLAEREG